jgi:hypothetical protein
MKKLISLLFIGVSFCSSCATIKAMDYTDAVYTSETTTTDDALIPLFDNTNLVIIKLGPGGRISNDKGENGGVFDTIKFLKTHPEKRIIIDGKCYSACTLLLTSENVYFTKNAEFYFHSASLSVWDGKQYVSSEPSVTGNKRMMEAFSMEVKIWLHAKKAFKSFEFVKMDNETAQRFFKNQFYVSDQAQRIK